MKITIYTINDCAFSKQEKDFLIANKLAFEEKNLETNKEFLTEMLAVSNNFAGTPVTKIEKDDGQIVVLKGFTLDEFNKTLNLTPAPTSTTPTVEETHVDIQAPVAPVVPQANDTLPPLDIPTPVAPTVPTPVMPVTPPAVPEPPVMPPTEPVAPAQPTMPVAPPTPVAPQTGPSNDQLNSILTDLQNKVNQPDLTPPSAPVIPNPDLGKTN